MFATSTLIADLICAELAIPQEGSLAAGSNIEDETRGMPSAG